MTKEMPFDPLDPQRDLVYAAEMEVFPRLKDQEKTLAELQVEVNRVLSLPWFRRMFPDIEEMKIKDGRGAKWSRTGDGSLHLLHVSRVYDVMYHELVHKVVPAGTEWHGAVFCGMLLFFINKLYDEKTMIKLRRAFKRRGVIWDKRIARWGDPNRNGSEGEA